MGLNSTANKAINNKPVKKKPPPFFAAFHFGSVTVFVQDYSHLEYAFVSFLIDIGLEKFNFIKSNS